MLVMVVVAIMSVLFTVQKYAARETLSGLERRYSASIVGCPREKQSSEGRGRERHSPRAQDEATIYISVLGHSLQIGNPFAHDVAYMGAQL